MIGTFSFKIIAFLALAVVASEALFLPSCLMRPLLGGPSRGDELSILSELSDMFSGRWIRDTGGQRTRRFLWTNRDACEWLCSSEDNRQDLQGLCARCCGWTTATATTTTTIPASTAATSARPAATPAAMPSPEATGAATDTNSSPDAEATTPTPEATPNSDSTETAVTTK